MTFPDFLRIALAVAAGYGASGSAFALAFHLRGLSRVDPATRGAGPGFRLLITPGIVALWPLLALRWWKGSPPPGSHARPAEPVAPATLRRAHGLAWKGLAVLLPLVVAAGLFGRPAS